MRSVCLLLAASIGAYCADIPVKNIVLYKHGVGYFERAGTLAAGEEAKLDFKTSDMNDVLKSLTVTDRTGLRVSGIRYDSNATLDQQLQDFPFQIAAREQLSVFLDGLRGARLEVKTKDGSQAGSIISAGEEKTNTTAQERVTLLLDSGEISNFDLAQVSSFRLTDAALQKKLRDYLGIVAKAQARDKRSIYIDSAGGGARDLTIAYIAPVAIWKSSYRLTLADEKSRLEGWAIVDNTTDEDWNGVGLSVVSGRPISFISLLDTPRFGNRQVAELPEDRAAGPQVYGGAIGETLAAAPAAAPVNGRSEQVEVTASSEQMGASFYSKRANRASTVEGATGATLGELFEYNFAGP